MVVIELKKNHLKAVADLEERLLPPHERIGYEKMLSNHRNECSVSYGVFENGNLVAYILTHKEIQVNLEIEESTSQPISYARWVSGFAGTSYKHIIPLVLAFCKNASGMTYRVKTDTRIRRVCKLLSKHYSDVLKIEVKEIDTEIVEVRISNKDNDTPIEESECKIIPQNVKKNFTRYFSYNLYSDVEKRIEQGIKMKDILSTMSKIFSLEEIKKHKGYVLKHINRRNIDYLNMMGDTITLLVGYGADQFRFGSATGYAEMISKLEADGYETGIGKLLEHEKAEYNEAYDKKYWAWKDDYQYRINWYRVQSLDYKKYYENTISYHRSKINRDVLKYFNGKKMFRQALIYDKYGSLLLNLCKGTSIYTYVPFNTSVTFENCIGNLLYEESLRDIMCRWNPEYKKKDYNDFYHTLMSYRLKKIMGKEKSKEFFSRLSDMLARVQEEKRIEAYHDIMYKVDAITNMTKRKYLTEGAYRYILLAANYEEIGTLNDILSALEISDEYVKYFDASVLRKQISKEVKKGNWESIKGIIDSTVKNAEAKFRKNRGLTPKVIAEIEAFLEKMKKYAPYVTFIQAYSKYKGNFLKFVRGTYPGLFEPAEYKLSYSGLTEQVMNCLGKHGEGATVKDAKKLYNRLSKVKDIKNIIEGNLSAEEYKSIVRLLKVRDVKVSEEIELVPCFTGKIEQKCNAEYLIAGDASKCCMSFAESKAREYALGEGFGIFNIYYNGLIIANSLIWIADTNNALVLDNIEINPNYEKYNHYIKNLYELMMKDMLKKYDLDKVLQGSTYNDLELYDDSSEVISLEDDNPRMVEKKDFYSDANRARVVAVNEEKVERKIYRLSA